MKDGSEYGNQTETPSVQKALEDKDGQTFFEDAAKHEINALVWRFLPSSVTLGAADEIACAMYGMLVEEWDKAVGPLPDLHADLYAESEATE